MNANPTPNPIPPIVREALGRVVLPKSTSHKGENGKVLIIGGSELFHAASRWSLDTASKLVDMVFYASTPSNNALIQQAKQNFWNGIVIDLQSIDEYITEADCVLIGPGMTRDANTKQLSDRLLAQYPNKKWVVDAGALQMIDPKLLTPSCISTPHHRELAVLQEKSAGLARLGPNLDPNLDPSALQLDSSISTALGGGVVIIKGATDVISGPDWSARITGGNAGMTKGGTGDVLAGLVAGLYANCDAKTASIVASYVNKAAGDRLYTQVGPYFNATDLVESVARVLWEAVSFSD